MNILDRVVFGGAIVTVALAAMFITAAVMVKAEARHTDAPYTVILDGDYYESWDEAVLEPFGNGIRATWIDQNGNACSGVTLTGTVVCVPQGRASE